MSETKSCTKCKVVFPATVEYYSRNRRVLNGLRAECKTCQSEYQKKYRREYLKKHRSNIYKMNSIHAWIRRRKPKPNKCPLCDKSIDTNKFQLANISGRYLMDVRDFIYICYECHLLFDNILKGERVKE